MTTPLNFVDKEKTAILWERRGSVGIPEEKSFHSPAPTSPNRPVCLPPAPGHLPPRVKKAEATAALNDKAKLQACADDLRTHVCPLHILFTHWLAKLVFFSFWRKRVEFSIPLNQSRLWCGLGQILDLFPGSALDNWAWSFKRAGWRKEARFGKTCWHLEFRVPR